jgi:hypothetical protein
MTLFPVADEMKLVVGIRSLENEEPERSTCTMCLTTHQTSGDCMVLSRTRNDMPLLQDSM